MNLQARINTLETELHLLSRDVAEDEQARQKLLAVTHQATAMLETPTETIWKFLNQVKTLFRFCNPLHKSETRTSTMY